jgi:hypothetical protein
MGERKSRSKRYWFEDVILKDRDCLSGVEYNNKTSDAASKRECKECLKLKNCERRHRYGYSKLTSFRLSLHELFEVLGGKRHKTKDLQTANKKRAPSRAERITPSSKQGVTSKSRRGDTAPHPSASRQVTIDEEMYSDGSKFYTTYSRLTHQIAIKYFLTVRTSAFHRQGRVSPVILSPNATFFKRS